MVNELVEVKKHLNFQPGTLEINDGFIEEQVNRAISMLDNIGELSDEKIDNLKKAKKKYSDLAKNLNAERLSIRKEYEAPYKKFKNDIDGYINKINSAISPVDKFVEDYENKQTQIRIDEVKELIKEAAPNYGVDPDEVPFNKTWSNKTFYKKSKKAKLEAITNDLKQIQKDKNVLATNRLLIDQKSEAVGENPEAWYNWLKTDIPITEILKKIELAAESKKRRIEQEKQQKEAQEAARRAIEESKLTTTEDGKKVNTETGEVVEDTYTVSFKVSGPEKQLNNLAKFLKANNKLDVVLLEEQKKVGK